MFKRHLLPVVLVLAAAGVAGRGGLWPGQSATPAQPDSPTTEDVAFGADGSTTLPEGVKIEAKYGLITGVAVTEGTPHKSKWMELLGTRYTPGSLDGTDVTRQLWRFADLVLEKPDRSKARIQVARPLWWFEATEAKVGSKIDLSIHEAGIDGIAEVLHIGPCTVDSRENKPGIQVVIGKIEHENAVVWDLIFNGDTAKPLGVTANHPLFSQDRNDWVPAGELKTNEQVRTIRSTAKLTEKTQRPGRHKVYNMEVHRSHSYYVSQFAILAHNTGLDCTKTPVYRGGTSTTARPIDMKIDPQTGLVQPGKGLSLSTDPQSLDRFGGPHRVKNIPDELQITQQGRNPNHHVISPKTPMTPERFQELLNQVVLE